MKRHGALQAQLKNALNSKDLDTLLAAIGALAGKDDISDIKARIEAAVHPPGEGQAEARLQAELDALKRERQDDEARMKQV